MANRELRRSAPGANGTWRVEFVAHPAADAARFHRAVALALAAAHGGASDAAMLPEPTDSDLDAPSPHPAD